MGTRPFAVLVGTLLLAGCNSVLLGGAPPRPPPDPGPNPRGPVFGSSIEAGPRVERMAGDIELQAFDMRTAEDGMRRRCPEGFAVSFIGSKASQTCTAPVYPYASRSRANRGYRPETRADEPPRTHDRCRPHDDVLVHYRCTAPPPAPEPPAPPEPPPEHAL